MKVLDATFLVDYLGGRDVTRAHLLAHRDETFVLPGPAYAEALVGEGNAPDGDVARARANLSWGEVYPIDGTTAVTAAEVTDEIAPDGPFLTGIDALVAAVGRELSAPVVTADGDLTHEATGEVVDVEAYR